MGKEVKLTAGKMVCDHCGKVIGVYEPMVLIVNGEMHETSRAASPVTRPEVEARYHRACYAQRVSSGPAAA